MLHQLQIIVKNTSRTLSDFNNGFPLWERTRSWHVLLMPLFNVLSFWACWELLMPLS